MTAPVRFALAGAAGFVAPRHLQAIRDTGCTLVAACDTSDSVGVLDATAPHAEFHLGFDSLAARIERLNREPETAVGWLSVCTPNHLHHPQCAAGMRLACNVVCEKPLVPTLALLDDLAGVERETGRRVFTILQLRLHPAVLALHERLARHAATGHDVELTYVTARGPWYQRSWKGDPARSFGIAANIGVHLFDLLHFLFGPLASSTVHLRTATRAAGVAQFGNARVRWFLSIDERDLPAAAAPRRAYRSIAIDGESVELSEGFAGLHTRSYEEILAGRGFGLDAVRDCIGTVAAINEAAPVAPGADAHPALEGLPP